MLITIELATVLVALTIFSTLIALVDWAIPGSRESIMVMLESQSALIAMLFTAIVLVYLGQRALTLIRNRAEARAAENRKRRVNGIRQRQGDPMPGDMR